MLYGFLITLFVLNCFLLILLVLIQQAKGSMGLGGFGGASQMIFGGSGGQDFFQKTTWVFGAILMGGSLVLALMKSNNYGSFNFIKKPSQAMERPVQLPTE